ncbi:MAG: hypothetical protein FVQ83_06225 [Chloroflexi bacterium]|nr:hypothetical protein [Chloroflexota bacterium]
MDSLVVLLKRVFIFAGLIVLILLVTDFNNRMTELTRLTAQHANDEQQLAALTETVIGLESDIDYATSVPAVEDWAREEGDMVRPGDYSIVPLTPEAFTPEAPSLVTPTPMPLTNWQIWMAWLFNREP